MIGPEAVAAYERDGYLIVESVFTPAEVDAFRAAIAKITDPEAGLGDYLEAERGPGAAAAPVRRIKNPAGIHKIFAGAIRDERLLRIMARLIGPDFRTLKGKINMKPARVGAPVEWHQDWAFYPHTNDSMLTASIFIDDITEENAPLMVIPGSHKGPTHTHHEDGRFVGVIDPEVIRRQEASIVSMTGPAGSCSFHHVRIVRGSPQNRSPVDRRMLVFPIVACDAWPLAGFQRTLEAVYGEVISGQSSITPRLENIPVRIPYPMKMVSLFELQDDSKAKYFEYVAPDA